MERGKKQGTWLRNAFYTGPDPSGTWCHLLEIKCAGLP